MCIKYTQCSTCTDGYIVPGPVSSLSATTAVTQLTFSWSPPSEPNGMIIVYELSFILSNEICSWNSTTATVNTSATQHTLRDLPPNTVVTFSVRAYTIIGPGKYVTGQAFTKLNVEPSSTVTAKVPGIYYIKF